MQLLPRENISDGAESCAQELLEALPPVMHFLRKHLRGRRRTLSMPQLRALALLGSTPAANLSAVADYLDTSLPTTSRIVTGLVSRGFVVRHECPSDRRQVELSLTAKGRAAMESARATARQKLVEELSTLDVAELRSVSRAMSLLNSVFAPQIRGADPCASRTAVKAEVK
jgi:DNA-binding MarR family transcriptional regulator